MGSQPCGRPAGAARPHGRVLGGILPAAWSFQLALRSRDLGSAWTTLHLLGAERAAELLGIPDRYTQVARFPVAYTIGTEFKPAKRPPVGSIVDWDLGQPRGDTDRLGLNRGGPIVRLRFGGHRRDNC